MRTAAVLLAGASVLASPGSPSLAAEARVEVRVVYASRRDLARSLDAAGRDGFACLSVARPDPGAGLPGVVVLLGRAAGAAPGAVAHRAIAGGWGGTDLRDGLDRAAGDGFRLCGVALDEGPPNPALVAVMSRRPDAAAPARYDVEVLKIYKESLVRLGARAAEGFVPVAAAPVADNRVPDMRSWLVVLERTGSAPREVAVRSNSGPEGLQKALNEQAAQGYRLDLAWKDGNDAVAMMSRPRGEAKGAATFAVDAAAVDKVHWLKGLYLVDVPHRGEERLVIRDASRSSAIEVEEDPLPAPGKYGPADAEALDVLGGHLSRHLGFAPAFASVRRGRGGALVLTTVLVSAAN